MARNAESDDALFAAQAAIYHALAVASPDWLAKRPAKPPGVELPMPLDAAVARLQQAKTGPSFRISAALLAYAVWGKPGADELRQAMRALLDTDLPAGRVLPNYEQQRFISARHALMFVENAVHEAQGGGACTKRNHLLNFSYDARFSIAYAEASVEVNRPMTDFIGRGNPSDWRAVAPELFLVSDPDPAPPGNPNQYRLKEVARATLAGAELSEYSNLLNISYQGSPTVELQYDLSCSQSCDVGVYEGLGGLSVDSGSAFIRGVDAQWTQLNASKALRHTFPNGDLGASFMNWLSLPALVMLMSWFIFDGACA